MNGSGLCECGCGGTTPIATRTDRRAGIVKGHPRRFKNGHAGGWTKGKPRKIPGLPANWLDRIIGNGNGCWIWDTKDGHGYGKYGRQRAHRLVYELLVGPIPDGLFLDHVCHSIDDSCPGGGSCPHRPCVNPDHLEPVTHVENVRRGRGGQVSARRAAAATHCPQGHEWTPENTKRTPRQKKCRACAREYAARKSAERKAS